MGSSVHQYSPEVLGPVTCATTLPAGASLLAATASDNLVHLLDLRTGQVAIDFRPCVGSAGLVKTLCVSGDGHTATLGHTSGYLSQLDLRTGRMRQSWKV